MKYKHLSDTPYDEIPEAARQETERGIKEGAEAFDRHCHNLQAAANAHDADAVIYWRYVMLAWGHRFEKPRHDFRKWDGMDEYQASMSAWDYADGVMAEDEMEAEAAAFAKWLEEHPGEV